MQNNRISSLLLAALLAAGCTGRSRTELHDRTVEASCGQCQFGMPGDGCDLALRFDGQEYFVTGTSIDEHGDSHAADGFCNAIRRARVTGRVEGQRFLATAFELEPEQP